jgi:hypothetical protein
MCMFLKLAAKTNILILNCHILFYLLCRDGSHVVVFFTLAPIPLCFVYVMMLLCSSRIITENSSKITVGPGDNV